MKSNGFQLQTIVSCVLWLQERERLKQEKRDEKRLNKERKLELRRLELEMVKELNKPNEDLCLPDQKVIVQSSPTPQLSKNLISCKFLKKSAWMFCD